MKTSSPNSPAGFRIGLIALCLALLAAPLVQSAPDKPHREGYFASAPEAAQAITFKEGYFIVQGKPTFLAGGEIHYSRVPRELWRDRLVRAKRLGLNTIQTYCFWNVHEPKEGVFDFSGNEDLDAWLSLVEELGMYSIVRPGPYNCAEWDNGGLPAWLNPIPGMEVRNEYPGYLRYAERYYEKIVPIIAKHQIHKGGSVIMMQIENEHLRDWGTESNSPYMKRLYEKAVAMGIQVPMFYSGQHHQSAPAGTKPFGPRTTPWFADEFWTGWFTRHGEFDPQGTLSAANQSWRIIAFGGGAYTYYPVHGGFNRGYGGFNGDPSYDYSAPIGEAGQIRHFYEALKHSSLFGSNFSELIANSHDDPARVASVPEGARALVRSSGEKGTIAFVENSGTTTAVEGTICLSAPKVELAPVRLEPLEMRTVLLDVPLTAHASIAWLSSGILNRTTLGDRTYMVCYGRAGEKGEAALKLDAAPKAPWSYDVANKLARTTFTYPAGDEVNELSITADGKMLVLLVMNTDLADRTWITEKGIFVGPAFVNEDLSMEFPMSGGKAKVYTASGMKEFSRPMAPAPALPKLTGWRSRDAFAEAAPGFDDSRWSASSSPKTMAAYDGFQNGYGWYRTKYTASSPDPVSLMFEGMADQALVFVNGEPQAEIKENAVTITPRPGENTIAILSSHMGRDTMFNFTGPVGSHNLKGLWGAVRPVTAKHLLDSWKGLIIKKGAPSKPEAINYQDPAFDDSSWASAKVDPHYIPAGSRCAWLRTKVEIPGECPDGATIYFPKVVVFAEVYVNGKQVPHGGRLRGTFAVEVGKLLTKGTNTIAVLIDSPSGGFQGAPILRFGGQPIVGQWRFQGGVGGMEETALIGEVANWKELLDAKWSHEEPAGAKPRFWRCDFGPVIPKEGFYTINLDVHGLSAGNVWLNGHNLGRYGFYQKIEAGKPANLYVPECWFGETNTLIAFDTKGNSPKSVSLQPIESRTRLPFAP